MGSCRKGCHRIASCLCLPKVLYKTTTARSEGEFDAESDVVSIFERGGIGIFDAGKITHAIQAIPEEV